MHIFLINGVKVIWKVNFTLCYIKNLNLGI